MDLSEADRQQVLASCVTTTEALMAGYRGYQVRTRPEPPAQGCPFLLSQEYVRRKYGPDGDWPVDLVRRITLRALIYQSGALQYLATINALAIHQPYGLGLGPIARSMVEVCGKICWLLDSNLNLRDGLRQRVARLLLDQADDATHRKRLMAELNHPDRALAGDAYRAARDEAAELFYDSEIDKSDKSGRLKLCGQAIPNPSKLIEIAVETCRSVGSRDGVYGYLSSMTHPTIFAFIESFPRLTSPGNDMPYLEPRTDAIFAAKLVSLGAISFYDGWRVIASWLGTSFQEADEFRAKHDELQRLIERFSAGQE